MGKGARSGIGILLLLVLAGGGGWYAFKRASASPSDVPDGAGGQGAPKKPQTVPVSAVKVSRKDIPIYLDGLGTVQAYQTVTIRTQVDGQIQKIAFTEGQDVHKGDLLVQIDPQPFQAQLEQAQAKEKQDEGKTLQDQAKVKQDAARVKQDEAKVRQDQAKEAQDQANLANARVNLRRLKDTVKLNAAAVSEQSVDDQQTVVTQLEGQIEADVAAIGADEAGTQADQALVQADEAGVKADAAFIEADQAAIRYAQTQLAYTTIVSPIDGRIGIRLIDIGNVVHTNDANGMVIVTQLQPISVLFTLPQQNLIAINDRMAQAKLPVIAIDSTGTAELDRGLLDLIDNQIDPTTGTIKLKSTFPNTQRRLWPGGFVNTRLLLDTRKDAALVPAPVIQQGPNGTFVFVIKADLTVEVRPVKVGLIQDGQAIIEDGVAPGEQVVLTGQDRLKAGTHVTINEAKTDASGKTKGKHKSNQTEAGGDAKPADAPPDEKEKEPASPAANPGAPK